MIKQLYRFLNPKFKALFLEYHVDFRPRYGHGKPAHPELLKIIESQDDVYHNILQAALKYKENIWTIKKQDNDPINPFWNNGFLPGLDIISIYTMLAEFNPKSYVEVGSGTSTKVAYKAIKEQKLDTKIYSIDPAPRAEIDSLADKIVRKPFENTDFEFLFELEEGDILFIDNSHRILPNSDSMVFFLEVLPKLKSGVIVHIHDVYLPYDYPQFMCDRFYSEQYGLAMYLLANAEKYKPLLPNYYIYENQKLAQILDPIWGHNNLDGVEKHGGSFWLRIS